MDLKLHLGVLWRFRWLLVGGLVLAGVLAFLAVFKVSSSGVSYRQSETFQAREVLFVNQPGFPYGWATQPNAIDKATGLPVPTNRFSDPAAMVFTLPRPTRDWRTATGLQAGRRAGTGRRHLRRLAVVDTTNPAAPGTPFINMDALSTNPKRAVILAHRPQQPWSAIWTVNRTQPASPSRNEWSYRSFTSRTGATRGSRPEVHGSHRSLPRRPDRRDCARLRAREPEAPGATSCRLPWERSRGSCPSGQLRLPAARESHRRGRAAGAARRHGRRRRVHRGAAVATVAGSGCPLRRSRCRHRDHRRRSSQAVAGMALAADADRRDDPLRPDQALHASGEPTVQPRALSPGRRGRRADLGPGAPRRPPDQVEEERPGSTARLLHDRDRALAGVEQVPVSPPRVDRDQGLHVLPQLPPRLLPRRQRRPTRRATSTSWSRSSSSAARSSGSAPSSSQTTNYNVFNHLRTVFPFLHYDPSLAPVLARGGRLRVAASAQHPIAFGALMALLVPLGIYRARTFGRRWWIATGLILLGSLATRSRTAILMLGAILIVYLLLRPVTIKRLWPAIIPALVVVHLALPGTLGSIKESFFPKTGLITVARGTSVGSGRLTTLGPALDTEFSPEPDPRRRLRLADHRQTGPMQSPSPMVQSSTMAGSASCSRPAPSARSASSGFSSGPYGEWGARPSGISRREDGCSWRRPPPSPPSQSACSRTTRSRSPR